MCHCPKVCIIILKGGNLFSVYQCENIFIAWLKTCNNVFKFYGKISDTKPVTHGVGRGSILGPLLFIVFLNDLTPHMYLSLDMYDDDSTLGASDNKRS